MKQNKIIAILPANQINSVNNVWLTMKGAITSHSIAFSKSDNIKLHALHAHQVYLLAENYILMWVCIL